MREYAQEELRNGARGGKDCTIKRKRDASRRRGAGKKFAKRGEAKNRNSLLCVFRAGKWAEKTESESEREGRNKKSDVIRNSLIR